MNEGKDIPGVIAPPPLIFGIPLVIGLVLDHYERALEIPIELLSWPVRAFGGALIAIIGAGFIATALIAFRRAETPPEPWEPTRALTFDGPYRVTRNPMYLGMAMIFFGLSLMAGSALMMLMLVAIIIVMNRYVIAREERYLATKFGQPYTDYLSRSRRWF